MSTHYSAALPEISRVVPRAVIDLMNGLAPVFSRLSIGRAPVTPYQ
jgi:hypothetical protein